MKSNSDKSNFLLELQGMTKSFPGVLANDCVDLCLQSGEVHALLGENGAGKSTLVKMIYGILKPDSGTIYYKGTPVEIDSPAKARELGIAMVFQHFSLFDSLSVVENISLGMDEEVDRETLANEIIEVSDRYGLPLDPHRHVYTLSVGERQRIEIVRCLLQKPQLLVMDEPTSVLTPQEVQKLFVTLKRLAGEGLAILYISHKLDEIKEICQKATILRTGKHIATVDVEKESTSSLATMMMGEEFTSSQAERTTDFGEIRLQVKGLNLAAAESTGVSLTDIDLDVRAGEIVGIAGVAGNGQDELLKALNGEESCKNNECIIIDGKHSGRLDPNARRRAGLASVPEKRLGHGAVPDMSLVDNAFMTGFQRMKLLMRGLINYGRTKKFANRVIDDFSVKTPGSNVQAESLSGGNLQKFIIGRELTQNPDILIISQPTWGVDAGAAQTIRDALRELANKGAAMLIISQDLDELMDISDRIGAICGGRLSRFYPTDEMTVEKVGLLMAGVSLDKGENNAA
ncbi:ABC transporter ATP-binding protein [Desulfosediminicola sp.]|uniref:ABC transporter ATP-binding protein n=1 Tax=Desulfosediminicola sp. TaxID=2886825 RepID=UPI003AF3120B